LSWIGRQLSFLALLLFCLHGIAFAEGEKISELMIKGNQRIESGVIFKAVKLRAGDTLTMEGVDADIRAIYKLGYFRDVRAERETSGTGVTLTYAVEEKPLVKDVKVEGNKEVTGAKIREAFDLKPKAIFSAADLTSGVRKVEKLYADQGYYLAEVKASTEKMSTGDIMITLKISEGEKLYITKIRFEGNRAFSDRKLKGVMETGEKWFLSWLTDAGIYKKEVLQNDAALIADLYYNNGYVNVKVGDPKVELAPDKSGLLVTIGITEGEQFRTGAIDFKGDLLEGKDTLARAIKLKSGEIFSRATVRNDIFALTDLYADKGYAFTNVTPLTTIDPAKKTVNITFDFEKGEKVYIDRINISGNSKTRDKVIRREMKLAEGDLYSSTALKKSKQNLMNTGFFEQANVALAKGRAPNKQDINVEVKEKATGTFSVGAGYSSVDGIVGQGSVQQANFLGLGIKANLAASLGGKSQTYNVGLTDPYFLDSRWTIGGDLYRTQRDFTDFTRRVTGGDMKAGYPLSDTMNTLWIYRYEDKKISALSLALQEQINRNAVQQPETSSTTSSIAATLTRNTTDYRLEPSRGMVNNLSVEFAGLGGTNRYLRYLGNTTVFFPFKWSTVFSLHGELGYIQGLGMEVPIDDKFYLGGINTIRGYSSRTVSPYRFSEVTTYPRDPRYPGNVISTSSTVNSIAFIGGDAETVFNAEFVFPILKDAGLRGVMFLDAGDSYEKVGDMFTRFLASYGFGFRWMSPMGPLRLEYGIPINPRAGIDKASGKFEFSIGGFF
jgi:outer membrane protein insertion porin family